MPELPMTNIVTFRQQKDRFFRKNPQSPIRERDFKGLSYYPENLELVFELPLEYTEGRELLELNTSVGDIRPFVRYARVSFTVNGTPCTLSLFAQAYDNVPETLFVPFKDVTSGGETYGAGRYLDIPRTGDRITLDFNYAYNPYCAYSDGYNCPYPPLENHLPVAILAGEKQYK